MVLVSNPGSPEHDNARESERRRDKALRCSEAESHALAQDDGKEVCDSVRDSRDTAEEFISNLIWETFLGTISGWDQRKSVAHKKINANPQIFKSNAGLRNFAKLKGSA